MFDQFTVNAIKYMPMEVLVDNLKKAIATWEKNKDNNEVKVSLRFCTSTVTGKILSESMGHENFVKMYVDILKIKQAISVDPSKQ